MKSLSSVLCNPRNKERGRMFLFKFGPKVKRKSCLFLRCPKVTLCYKKLKTNEM